MWNKILYKGIKRNVTRTSYVFWTLRHAAKNLEFYSEWGDEYMDVSFYNCSLDNAVCSISEMAINCHLSGKYSLRPFRSVFEKDLKKYKYFNEDILSFSKFMNNNSFIHRHREGGRIRAEGYNSWSFLQS